MSCIGEQLQPAARWCDAIHCQSEEESLLDKQGTSAVACILVS